MCMHLSMMQARLLTHVQSELKHWHQKADFLPPQPSGKVALKLEDIKKYMYIAFNMF